MSIVGEIRGRFVWWVIGLLLIVTDALGADLPQGAQAIHGSVEHAITGRDMTIRQ
jgi:hypothetical protein